MNKQTSTVLATLLATAALVGFGRELYKNDFATRSSYKDMPGNRWFSSTYAYPASLAYGYWAGGITFTPSVPYEENPASVQDGWAFIQGPTNSNGITWSFNRRYVEFWARTQDDANNPFACFSATDGTNVKNHRVYAIQPIYNAFTNGSIRLSIDFRVPTRYYGAYDGAFLRMGLVCANGMSPSNQVTGTRPLSIGFNEDGKDLRPLDRWGYSSNSDLPTSSRGSYDRTHWFRHVADISLDSNTYSCRVYDMGTTQPSLTTPTPSTVFGTASGSSALVTTATGPVCGLGLEMYRSTRYSRDSDNALILADCPCIDNIRVWWRAPETGTAFSDADLCYENDFKTRRVRTLSQGTTSTDYSSALVETTTDTYTYWDYVSKSAGNVASVENLVKGYSTGRDGWKPKSYTPCSYRVVYTSEDGGNVLAAIRVNNSDHYSKISHQLGQTISSGKVRFEYDFRTPDAWVNYYNSHHLSIRLGDATQCGLNASDGASLVNTGFGGASGYVASDVYPYVMANDTSYTLSKSTWYRARVIADLSTRTFDYELYLLGSVSVPLDRAVPATPVFTKTGVGFSSSTATTITSIAVHGYDIGKTYAGAFLVDNIRLWKGTDGTNWDIVFQTDFNKRVFYGRTTVQRGDLLDADVNRVGLDAWVRRGSGSAEMYLLKTADNPCVVIDGEGTGAEAVHTLGKTVTKGKVVVRADIRPPSRMTTKAPYPAAIYAGGDEYAQGETCTSSARRLFRNAAFGAFGFSRAGSAGDLNYYSQVKPFVKGADGETLGDAISGDNLLSWYRFVATFDLDAKTWRVDVYKQGTVQPTAASADGTLVKSFENLTFINDDPSGFSAIGIAGGGTTGDKPLEADKRSVLFDNLTVTGDDFGMVFLVK